MTEKTGLRSSLKVRRVPTVHGTTRVVLLPGHEFPIEHFLPQNLQRVRYLVDNKRVWLARSSFKPGNKWLALIKRKKEFIEKRRRRSSSITLDMPSEARLARHLRGLDLPGVEFEEPLAVILQANGDHRTVYRKFQPSSKETITHRENARRLGQKLDKLGLRTPNLQ